MRSWSRPIERPVLNGRASSSSITVLKFGQFGACTMRPTSKAVHRDLPASPARRGVVRSVSAFGRPPTASSHAKAWAGSAGSGGTRGAAGDGGGEPRWRPDAGARAVGDSRDAVRRGQRGLATKGDLSMPTPSRWTFASAGGPWRPSRCWSCRIPRARMPAGDEPARRRRVGPDGAVPGQAARADECRLLKDVDGVYDGDPNCAGGGDTGPGLRGGTRSFVGYGARRSAGGSCSPRACSLPGRESPLFRGDGGGRGGGDGRGAGADGILPARPGSGVLRIGLLGLGTVGLGV